MISWTDITLFYINSILNVVIAQGIAKNFYKLQSGESIWIRGEAKVFKKAYNGEGDQDEAGNEIWIRVPNFIWILKALNRLYSHKDYSSQCNVLMFRFTDITRSNIMSMTFGASLPTDLIPCHLNLFVSSWNMFR